MFTDKFKIDVPDWTKVDIACAKMILDEGQNYFIKYLEARSDKLTNRAFAVLAILIPITSALIGFVFTSSLHAASSMFIRYLLGCTVVILIAIMFGLGIIVFPRLSMAAGTLPKEICTQEYLGVTLDPELARLALVLGLIENFQIKIEYNEKQLFRRTRLLKKLMLALGCLFAAVIVAAFCFLSFK